MRMRLKTFATLAVSACVAIAGFTLDGDLTSLTTLRIVPEAQAIIGRPLTPVSYAGVARRTTRRTVAVAAAATPPPPPPPPPPAQTTVVVTQPAQTTVVTTPPAH